MVVYHLGFFIEGLEVTIVRDEWQFTVPTENRIVTTAERGEDNPWPAGQLGLMLLNVYKDDEIRVRVRAPAKAKAAMALLRRLLACDDTHEIGYRLIGRLTKLRFKSQPTPKTITLFLPSSDQPP